MAKINYDYCEEKDLYNSGSIEEELLEIYKSGRKATTADNPDFFYTVTPIRENIINWYPFKKDSTILEVGGGLGAITGSLCKVAKKVVSNEYSKRRAENIYYRHKECQNLEVIVGNLNKIEFKEKFDYIVLIGVFEYAKRFCQTENPFHDFLNNLKKILKDNGVILIAIENRYGIKYFAGATEDHYGEKYLGLYGYDTKDIQTLGKEELSNIINDCGFKYHRYYYPYPDYKMPYIIYTDERLPLKTEIPDLFLYNHGEQYYDYDYRNVLPGIIDNKQYGFFANSFLVEITNNQDNISKINYAKTSLIRAEECQIYTVINKNNKIKKTPKNSLSNKHLENMITINKKLKELGLKVADIKKNDNSYEIEYIDGETVAEYILKLVEEKKVDLIKAEIDKFYNMLKQISTKTNISKYAITEEKDYFKDKQIEILKINLFDLHLSNIIKNNDDYYIIDQEWCSKFDIPINYMLYFAINYLFKWVKNLENLIKPAELYEKYNISAEEREIYNLMSIYIAKDEYNNIDQETLKFIMNQNFYKDTEMAQQELKDEIGELRIKQDEYILEQQNLNQKNYNLEQENRELKIKQDEYILEQQDLNQKNSKLEQENIGLQNKFNLLEKEYNNMINSKSWKITMPIRKLRNRFSRIRGIK